jgi:hypothetical protein
MESWLLVHVLFMREEETASELARERGNEVVADEVHELERLSAVFR